MRTIVIGCEFALAALLLSGCVFWFHEYAKVITPQSTQAKVYRLRIQKVTHTPEFNPHALAVSNTFCIVDFELPHYPTGIESFDVTGLRFSQRDCPEFAVALKSGELTIDKTHGRVSIQAVSEAGPSKLNGSYSLHRDSDF